MDPRNWIVALKQPAIVHDVLRYPVEGGIPASDKEAQRLFENDLLVGDPEPIEQPGDEDGAGDGPDYERDNLSALDLKKADKNQPLVIAAYEQAEVPQGDAATKPDLVKAIEAKRKASAS
jgi:hypothetical protein